MSEEARVQDIFSPPMIEPDSHLFKEVRVNAGVELRLHISVRGRPTPTFDWEFNDTDLVSEANCMIEKSKDETTIVIKEATREHTGRYKLVAQNACGIRSHEFRVHVLDRPD